MTSSTGIPGPLSAPLLNMESLDGFTIADIVNAGEIAQSTVWLPVHTENDG